MTQCKQCQTGFEIVDWDRKHYTRMQVPEPTLCPDCRQQRRMAWRNERSLYHNVCKRCNKSIVSLYDTDSPFTVYCQACWWSDAWDPLSYGQEFDFSRPFFEQYRELQKKVPRLCLYNLKSENSEYTNHSANNRNCYMGLAFGGCEDCLYGHWVMYCRDVLDSAFTDKCEQGYELLYCINCFEAFFSEYSENLKACWMCFECKGCENCIGCTQLQYKKFHVLNEEVSPKEFERIKNEMLENPAKFQEIMRQYQTLKSKAPRRATRQINCENCKGSDLVDCKNAEQCFNGHTLEDCKYIFDAGSNKNGMDNYEHGWLEGLSELIYECHAGMACYFIRFCHMASDSRELTYCDSCTNNSANCFGCIGLKHKKYCILNKQYSKEEYETLVPKIIEHMKSTSAVAGQAGEWGEFFPISLSPFAYNETSAPAMYPLTKEEVIKRGWRWKNHHDEVHKVMKTISARRLPDHIQGVPDDILNWAIECEATGRLFRITAQELKFYRHHRLPAPHFHPDERHRRRMQLRPPRRLFSRSCDQCKKSISSVYAPDRPEIVYCENCYLKTVY